jgi:hypothetical protein
LTKLRIILSLFSFIQVFPLSLQNPFVFHPILASALQRIQAVANDTESDTSGKVENFCLAGKGYCPDWQMD